MITLGQIFGEEEGPVRKASGSRWWREVDKRIGSRGQSI